MCQALCWVLPYLPLFPSTILRKKSLYAHFTDVKNSTFFPSSPSKPEPQPSALTQFLRHPALPASAFLRMFLVSPGEGCSRGGAEGRKHVSSIQSCLALCGNSADLCHLVYTARPPEASSPHQAREEIAHPEIKCLAQGGLTSTSTGCICVQVCETQSQQPLRWEPFPSPLRVPRPAFP